MAIRVGAVVALTGALCLVCATQPPALAVPGPRPVPDVRCLSTAEAVEVLADYGYDSDQGFDDVLSGVVIEQSPPSGTLDAALELVDLTVVDTLVVPAVEGLAYPDAVAAADAWCLDLVAEGTIDDTVVISQNPEAGAAAVVGDDVFVSMGIVVPSDSPVSPPVESETTPTPSEPTTDDGSVVVPPTEPPTTTTPGPGLDDGSSDAESADPVGWWSDRGNQIVVLLLIAAAILLLLGGWVGNARVRRRRDLRWVRAHVTVAALPDRLGRSPAVTPLGQSPDVGIGFVVIRPLPITRIQELP